MKYQKLTDKIIDSFFTVYNKLGYGFLEQVYGNALGIELEKNDFDVQKEFPIKVFYKQKLVGNYKADLLVNNCVIVELKATSTILKEHEAQLLNYLYSTKIEVGLLFNFGPRPDIKRKVFDNDKKPWFAKNK